MGAWYRAGTVAVTNGDVHVTGTNTLWTSQASQGDIFSLDGDKFYEIASITDDTHLVLQKAFLGATASAQSYEIIRNFTSTTNAQLASNLAGMLDQWHQYLDDMLGWLGGTGTVTVHDANNTAYQVKTPAQLNAETDGVLSLSVAGGTGVTLTDTQFGHRQFVLTGALTANINVIVPASEPRVINVWNQTTGAFTLTIKTAASGSTGVTVAPGARADILTDGTNAYYQNTTAAINTGSMDGVPIGQTTPAAATFTTLTANGDVNLLQGSSAINTNKVSIGGYVASAGGVRNGSLYVDGYGNLSISSWNMLNFYTNNGGLITSNPALSIDNTTSVATFAAGIRLSNGAATLSAYEEGTFTPTIAGSSTAGANTYSAQTGTYTRVGRTIHFKILLTLSAKDAAMAGSVLIAGLPYMSSGAGLTYCAVNMGVFDDITFSAGNSILDGYIAPSNTYITVVQTGNNIGNTALPVSGLAATSSMQITGTYNI